MPPVEETWSFNHWTTGKSHLVTLTIIIFLSLEFAQGKAHACIYSSVLTYAQILSKYRDNTVAHHKYYFWQCSILQKALFTSSLRYPLKIDTAICQFVFPPNPSCKFTVIFHLDLIFPSFKVGSFWGHYFVFHVILFLLCSC